MTIAFQTASDATFPDPKVVAETVLSAMAGVSRTMLEKEVTRGTMTAMERELTVMVRAYLEASARPVIQNFE